MEEFLDRPIVPIVGASFESGHETDLPLVVWLRGDEPHCAEFVLDADEVMSLLGIRRSRLTQISGRELRVGRLRRGRYVSPVYRPEDVEAYGNWTRATATHAKSSALLQDALEEIRQQGASLTTGFDESLRRGSVGTARLIGAQLDGLRPEFGALERRLAAGEVALHQSRLEQRLAAEALAGEQSKQSLLLQLSQRELSELLGLWRLMRQEQDQQREALRGLGEQIETLRQLLVTVNEPSPATKPKVKSGRAGARRLAAAARALPAKTAPLPRPRRLPQSRK